MASAAQRLSSGCRRRALPAAAALRLRPLSSGAGPAAPNAYGCDRATGVVSPIADGSSLPSYQTVIGLEIHARLTSCPTKLFSSSPNSSSPNSSSPNSSLSPFDLAHPGSLPVLSATAARQAALSARALGCAVNPVSRFERKHYFWWDLPHGYQITQQRWPLGGEGTLRVRRGTGAADPGGEGTRGGRRRKARGRGKGGRAGGDGGGDGGTGAFFDAEIDRVQLEIDTAKTSSRTDPATGTTESLLDLNRAGCPLVEIVFRPTIRSANEAADAVETVRKVLRFAGTCDGRMEGGNLRVDLNVSVARISAAGDEGRGEGAGGRAVAEELYAPYLPANAGHRTEVKNLNSLRQVVQAAEYEALRQAAAAAAGDPAGQETRTFDAGAQRTVRIRDKGGDVDYRYMPEPDLPPLVLDGRTLHGMGLGEYLERSLPDLPEDVMERLMGEEYGLSDRVATVLTADPAIVDLYEVAVGRAAEEVGLDRGAGAAGEGYRQIAASVANWLCNDLFSLLKEGEDQADDSTGTDPATSPVDGQRLGSLVAALHDGTISTPMGKKILAKMFHEEPELGPREIAELNGWKLIKDFSVLRQLCHDVVNDEAHAKQLEQYRNGGKHVKKVPKFFIGKIMAVSGGNAHPGLAAEALDEVLEEMAPGARDL